MYTQALVHNSRNWGLGADCLVVAYSRLDFKGILCTRNVYWEAVSAITE